MKCDEVKLYIQYYQQDYRAGKIGPKTDTLIKKLPPSVNFILNDKLSYNRIFKQYSKNQVPYGKQNLYNYS